MKTLLNSTVFETCFLNLLRGTTFFSVGLFFLIFLTMVIHGIEYLSFSFLVDPSTGGGYSGGVRYQILGTLILVVTAGVLTIPFSTAFALLYAHYNRSQKVHGLLFLLLHLVNSTPSILFGILGYLLLFKGLGWQKSWLSGGIILAVMMLPTVTESLVERIKTIPLEYIAAAKAMGFNDDKIVLGVILPYAWGGLLTGLVLGVSRAAGETAPILFTAAVFSGATLPTGIVDNPVLALPNHIFNLAQDISGTGGIQCAWATAVVLTLLSSGLCLLASPFRARSHEEAKA